jgi:hypothetical protein
MQWSSLQNITSKFMPKGFYEIDPSILRISIKTLENCLFKTMPQRAINNVKCHKMPQKATKGHKMPLNTIKCHKMYEMQYYAIKCQKMP